jgi:hypothetical protein
VVTAAALGTNLVELEFFIMMAHLAQVAVVVMVVVRLVAKETQAVAVVHLMVQEALEHLLAVVVVLKAVATVVTVALENMLLVQLQVMLEVAQVVVVI